MKKNNKNFNSESEAKNTKSENKKAKQYGTKGNLRTSITENKIISNKIVNKDIAKDNQQLEKNIFETKPSSIIKDNTFSEGSNNKKILNYLNNGKKISEKNKKKIKFIIDNKFSLFFKKIKNSYNKMGKISIKNFFYDITNKNPEKQNLKNSIILLIDNKKDSINPINDTEIKNIEKLKSTINHDTIYQSDEYTKDIYYNKKQGLYNSGSTCYLNSFIQILIHIPGLIKNLMDYKNSIDKSSLLYALLNVVDRPSREGLYNLRKEFFYRNSNCKSYSQEDSQEFGSEFLKILNDELSELEYFISQWKLEEEYNMKNNYKNTNAEKKLEKLYNILSNDDSNFQFQTIINDFFYFYESELIICNNKAVNISYYGDVDNQLPFNSNDYYKKDLELIDMLKNKYLRGNYKLIKLPKVFNITLLRAVINKPLIKTKVIINEDIDLREFLDKDFGDYSKPTSYQLYALNVCVGQEKRYGHYYSFILINNEWFKFDDLRVEKVNIQEIKQDLPYIYGIYYINKKYLQSL